MSVKRSEFYVICHNIRSLFNVGSIFRTADCFGVDKIFLTGITGRPPRREISKVALGAENFIPWEYHSRAGNLIKKLRFQGVRIIALEQTKQSADLANFKPKFPLALVLGHETKGLPKSVLSQAAQIIGITMYGKKESLNVAVAFGIAANHIAGFKFG